MEHLIPLAERDFYSLMSMTEAVVSRWDPQHLREAESWVESAAIYSNPENMSVRMLEKLR